MAMRFIARCCMVWFAFERPGAVVLCALAMLHGVDSPAFSRQGSFAILESTKGRHLAMAFSPDSRSLGVFTTDNAVLFEVYAGQKRAWFAPTDKKLWGYVHGAFSPDGKTIALCLD